MEDKKLFDKGIVKMGNFEFPQENRLFTEEDIKKAIDKTKQILKDSICSGYDIETSSTINSWIEEIFNEEFGEY